MQSALQGKNIVLYDCQNAIEQYTIAYYRLSGRLDSSSSTNVIIKCNIFIAQQCCDSIKMINEYLGSEVSKTLAHIHMLKGDPLAKEFMEISSRFVTIEKSVEYSKKII